MAKAECRSIRELIKQLDTAWLIDQFEVAQAQRIYAGYQVLGPMLQAMEEGRPAAGFEKKWGNLGKMRSALPADLKRLRASARAQDQQGITDIQLQFPHYALFTD